MVDAVNCYTDGDDSKTLLKNFRDGRNIMLMSTYLDHLLSTLSKSLEGKGNTGWQVRGDEQVNGGTMVSGEVTENTYRLRGRRLKRGKRGKRVSSTDEGKNSKMCRG